MYGLYEIAVVTALCCTLVAAAPFSSSNDTVTGPLTWDVLVTWGVFRTQTEAPQEHPTLIQVVSGYFDHQNSESEILHPTMATLFFNVASPYGSSAMLKFATRWWQPLVYSKKTLLGNNQEIRWPPALMIEDALSVLLGAGFRPTFNRFHLDWRTKAFGSCGRVDQPYWTFEWMEKPYQRVHVGMDRRVERCGVASLEDFADAEEGAMQEIGGNATSFASA